MILLVNWARKVFLNIVAVIIYNYPPMGRWIVVDIYRDAKRRGIYPLLFTDPEGDSCFSIYQIRWIKKRFLNFFFWNFRETRRHFSLRSQNSKYPRIFRVTGANQNARKLLSTDFVNTKNIYHWICQIICPITLWTKNCSTSWAKTFHVLSQQNFHLNRFSVQ